MTTTIKHLYIHVPFCKTICYYCDFCHRIYDSKLVDKWLSQLAKQINNHCHEQYETIYIGGGTPTSLSNLELEKLLTLIKPYSNEVKEYTIEVNPESLDIDKINLFNKYGINRISMGVQSSDDNLLKQMNRHHSFKDVKEKIELLRNNGISNISIDLMYSLPNQTMAILKNTLADFLSLKVPHVSLYSLTIEENSVFNKKGLSNLDEDIEADMYDLIESTLLANNYLHYEVSNYCLEGYESKHNLGYWHYDNFLGLSLGASSKIDHHRFSFTRNFKEYFIDCESKCEEIELTDEDLMFENIMMSLRTREGLNIKEFNEKYHCDFISKYQKGLSNKQIEIVGDNVRVKNLAILNNVLLDFMETNA